MDEKPIRNRKIHRLRRGNNGLPSMWGHANAVLKLADGAKTAEKIADKIHCGLPNTPLYLRRELHREVYADILYLTQEEFLQIGDYIPTKLLISEKLNYGILDLIKRKSYKEVRIDFRNGLKSLTLISHKVRGVKLFPGSVSVAVEQAGHFQASLAQAVGEKVSYRMDANTFVLDPVSLKCEETSAGINYGFEGRIATLNKDTRGMWS